MRNLKTALGAGVAAIAAIGFCGMALAQAPQIHTMTVTLPGGGVEQIQYTGPVISSAGSITNKNGMKNVLQPTATAVQPVLHPDSLAIFAAA